MFEITWPIAILLCILGYALIKYVFFPIILALLIWIEMI